jgi:predicted phosphate transport protein (TIGR00153 family)
MNINNILSVFSPKDTKFLPLLQELSGIMVKTASLLNDLVAFTEDAQRDEVCRLIKAEEIKGDKVSAKVLKELNNTFITPFDREDINALADKIEEVIDVLNRAAQKVLLYNPTKFPIHSLQLTEIVSKGSLEVQGAVNELSHLKKTDGTFRKHYKEIKALEEEADVVYEQGIMTLFRNETDPVELIKLKEIIQELEKAANKVNSTGKILKSIFVKYA